MLFRIVKRAPWIVLGAAVAWFWDPVSGAGRRKEARQKLEDLSGGDDAVADHHEPSFGSTPVARAS